LLYLVGGVAVVLVIAVIAVAADHMVLGSGKDGHAL
jgi:hypothetical protein